MGHPEYMHPSSAHLYNYKKLPKFPIIAEGLDARPLPRNPDLPPLCQLGECERLFSFLIDFDRDRYRGERGDLSALVTLWRDDGLLELYRSGEISGREWYGTWKNRPLE